MRTELTQHAAEYTILTIFGVGALILFLNIQNTMMRIVLLDFVIGYYVVWALIHHMNTKTLSLKVVLEYVLIALVAMIALQITVTPYL